ncbi:MAG: NAD(P)-dependent oxidoreductase [Actinomycetota bacterium]
MSNVTVLGLGAMGERVAGRLAAAGHAVTVWNRSSAAATRVAGAIGATTASSPAAAVTDADVVLCMVADDGASRDVWLGDDGALDAVRTDAVAVEASTVSVQWSRELAEHAAAADVDVLTAPVVGSRPQAEAGALFSLVGGDTEVLRRVEPVLGAYSGTVRHVGRPEDAAVMKLAINAVFGVQVAAYAEAVGVVARAGIDESTAIEVFTGLPITGPGLQRALGLFAARDFAPNFPIRLVAKDFGYVEQMSDGVSTEILDAAASVFRDAANTDDADLDITGIARALLAQWEC